MDVTEFLLAYVERNGDVIEAKRARELKEGLQALAQSAKDAAGSAEAPRNEV